MNSLSKYILHLGMQEIDNHQGNSRKKANQNSFPLLKGLSLYLLELNPLGLREPHWHLNAHELCYCISGKAKITIFGPEGLDVFSIESGSIAYIPQGYIHSIENLENFKTVLAVGFNHELPSELALSTIFSAPGSEVLSATFDKEISFFSRFPIPPHEVEFVNVAKNNTLSISKSGKHKFKLNSIDPQVDVDGGSIALSHRENFPILKGISVFDLKINVGGVREPHWHPNAAELDYVISGKAKMLIMAPDGTKDVFEVGPGDVVFIPTAYYHYIQNIGTEPTHFAVFFNHESPSDIGLSGTMGAFAKEQLAAVLSCTEKDIEPITHYDGDVFIGPRLLNE